MSKLIKLYTFKPVWFITCQLYTSIKLSKVKGNPCFLHPQLWPFHLNYALGSYTSGKFLMNECLRVSASYSTSQVEKRSLPQSSILAVSSDISPWGTELIFQTALGVASEPGAQTQWLLQAHTQHLHCGTLCSQRGPTCPSLQLGSDLQACQQVRQLCTKLVQRNRHMYSDVCAVCVCVYVVAQSCPTLCNPMDCSPPGSSVHGILQERLVQWVAIPFSKGSSWPRDQTQVSCIAGRFFTIWTTREASEGRASNSPFKIFFRFCCNQFSSVAQSCLTLCDPTDYSMPGFPVHRQLPELAQTHVHRVSDATQTSHPLSFSSPPALLLLLLLQ